MDKMNDKVTQAAERLCLEAAHATQIAIQQSGTTNMAAAMYMACLTAIGAVQVGASIIGVAPPGKDNGNPSHRCTADSLLFVALLVNKISPGAPAASGHSTAEFGPEIYHEALVAFEKLTGRRPDAALNKHFTESARLIAEEAANPLAQFTAGRQQDRSASKTQ